MGGEGRCPSAGDAPAVFSSAHCQLWRVSQEVGSAAPRGPRGREPGAQAGPGDSQLEKKETGVQARAGGGGLGPSGRLIILIKGTPLLQGAGAQIRRAPPLISIIIGVGAANPRSPIRVVL